MLFAFVFRSCYVFCFCFFARGRGVGGERGLCAYVVKGCWECLLLVLFFVCCCFVFCCILLFLVVVLEVFRAGLLYVNECFDLCNRVVLKYVHTL